MNKQRIKEIRERIENKTARYFDAYLPEALDYIEELEKEIKREKEWHL